MVAGEVEDLANETAKAIEDIGRRIASLQADSPRSRVGLARTISAGPAPPGRSPAGDGTGGP